MNADQAPGTDVRTERTARLAACLAKAMAGELSALDTVVAELNPLLWHVARSQGLAEEDAADVVQTSWLELVRQLHTIRSPLALTGWLVSATKREAWRVNARRRKHAGPGVEALGDPPDTVPEPIEQVCEGERDQALWRQFAQLSERCRTLLRVIAQASRPDYASIADALDMPRGSIGPTRGRCLAKLRTLLLGDPAWSTE